MPSVSKSLKVFCEQTLKNKILIQGFSVNFLSDASDRSYFEISRLLFHVWKQRFMFAKKKKTSWFVFWKVIEGFEIGTEEFKRVCLPRLLAQFPNPLKFTAVF